MNERSAFGRDVHRYLDGEPHGPLGDEERRGADRLAAAAQALAAETPALGAAVDDAVMAAVRVRPAPGRRGAWRWLVEPQPVRVRPVWVPLALAAALALWLVPRAFAPAASPAPSAVAAGEVTGHDTVFVHFELAAPAARAVAVAGSFNGWRPEQMPMRRGDGGVWSVTVPLALGEYRYQFVVDGQQWVVDPTAHALVDDGFGGRNSVIVVGPKGVVRS